MRVSDDSPELSRLAETNSPAFLFDHRGALVWANAAAAVYWGTPRRAALIATDFTRHAVAEQARTLARSLPASASRLERLRLVPFGRNTPMIAEVKRLTDADGEGMVLVTSLERVAAARVAAMRAAEAAEAPPRPAAPESTPAAEAGLARGAEAEAQKEDAVAEPAGTVQAEEGPPSEAEPQEREAPAPVEVEATAEASPPAETAAQQEPAEAEPATADQADASPAPEAEPEATEEPAAIEAAVDTIASAPSEAEAVPEAPEPPPATQADAAPESEPELAEEPAAEADLAQDPPPPALPPRVAALAARERPLRFAWQTDAAGRLTQISPDFVAAVGTMPEPDETLAAFAARSALDDGALAVRLSAGGRLAPIEVAWPLADTARRAIVELAAAPAGSPGGLRGFGILRGLTPEATDDAAPAAEAPVTADTASEDQEASETPSQETAAPQAAEPEAAPSELIDDTGSHAPNGASEPPKQAGTDPAEPVVAVAANDDVNASEPPPSPAQTAAASASETPVPAPGGLAVAVAAASPEAANVLRFPGAPAAGGERRLAPSDEAALRTIARVLGGPIAVASAEAAPQPRPAPEEEVEPVAVPSALFAGPSLEAAEVGELRRALAAARERESELRGILDTASDGVVLIDGQGRIEALNRAAEALFGVESAEIAGEPFLRLIAPDSQRAAADYLDGLARHGVASLLNDGREVTGLERHGGTIPLFMTMGRLASGVGGERYCAVLRDITQWKSAERELIEAKRQAERASHQKSDFLAKISHEIRTPLNTIIGFSEVMLEERFGRIENERYRGYLADIRASGEHLLSLVNDLLDLSKIESGRIDLIFGQVKLADIAQQAVATMQPQANREGVILRTSLPPMPPVVADARSIRQILFNLLSNAVKFTRSGGQVIVSLSATDAGEIALRVRDTGIGMSPAEIAMAMEPFRQVATRSRFEAEGTGLGLPLTKALAEANRAMFSIDSHPGEGTLVQIVFPTTRVLAE